MKAGRDVYYDDMAKIVSADCPLRGDERGRPAVHASHLGLDRKPKGVLHTTGGYLVYTAITHQYVFDYHDGDIYWCTATSVGHRPQLHRLRPALQRRHNHDVRGRAEYPSVSFLGSVRQAQGQCHLHRAEPRCAR